MKVRPPGDDEAPLAGGAGAIRSQDDHEDLIRALHPNQCQQCAALVGFVGDMVAKGVAELWQDTHARDCCVSIDGGVGIQSYRIRSDGFRLFLLTASLTQLETVPTGSTLKEAIEAVYAVTECLSDREYEARVRVARLGDHVYLDLGGDGGHVVEVGPAGWNLTTNPPVRFIQPSDMLPLPLPARGGSIETLRRFVNVASDADFVLLVGGLVAMFHPQGPYPVLILNGEAGAAKSTTARMIMACIDPRRPALRALSSDERDLAIAARNGWVLSFDNLSGISQKMSDAICRLATGGGIGTRRLYTDLDEIRIDVCRPVVLNGIDSLSTAAGRNTDLFDRAIVLELPALSMSRLQTEDDLWSRFAHAQPQILGALLDAVSAAIRGRHTVHPPRLTRMADAVQWVTAAETALPWSSGTFATAMEANRRNSEVDALEASPLHLPLAGLLKEHRGRWRGTATDLYQALDDQVGTLRRKPCNWPVDAVRLAGQLRRHVRGFAATGINVTFERERSRDRTRIIVVERMDSAGRHADDDAGNDQAGQDASDGADGTSDKKKRERLTRAFKQMHQIFGPAYPDQTGERH